jgi:hypothetical protein
MIAFFHKGLKVPIAIGIHKVTQRNISTLLIDYMLN